MRYAVEIAERAFEIAKHGQRRELCGHVALLNGQLAPNTLPSGCARGSSGLCGPGPAITARFPIRRTLTKGRTMPGGTHFVAGIDRTDCWTGKG
jgi:hypothetical protein